MKRIVTDKVVYVEPNMCEDYTSYDSSDNRKVYKSVNLEDMCVVVGLEVEIKGRTYDGNNNVLRMVWTSNDKGDNSISFLKGTKLKTTTGEVNVLTTSFTDTYLKDIEIDGTCEMFGIKSIDVSYNNMMVPEVTINFVDVRGVSLFAQEEMRHHLSNGNMTGIADNNIDGSFFKAFFTFPYPRFILYVKGFYGKMVSYELTCSDFRSEFDSNTGNFNVTATFIGYAFSFLNDVMVAGLLAAPYSEYIGKDYWKSSVEDRFRINGIEMPTLGEICKKYASIQEDVANELKKTPNDEIAKKLNLPEEDQQILAKEGEGQGSYAEFRARYFEVIGILNEIENKISNGSGFQYFEWAYNTGGDYIFVCKKGHDEIDGLVDDNNGTLSSLRDLLNNAKNTNYNAFNAWKANGYTLDFKDYGDYDNMVEYKQVTKESIENDTLRNEINSQSTQPLKDYNTSGSTYYDAWCQNNSYFAGSCHVYIFESHGLEKILGERNNGQLNDKTPNQKQTEEAHKKLENGLLNEAFHKEFKFQPTVENITKIFMAHVETFIHMIKQCSDNILKTNRTVGSLGINKLVIPDCGKNNPTGITNETIVAPFPKITHLQTSNDDVNTNRWEDEWIGNVDGATSDKFEEIKLIDGILNGIADVKQTVSASSNGTVYPENDNSNTDITYPLAYYDLVLDNGDAIFGNNINFTDVNEIFARFAIRCFSLIATHHYKPDNFGRCGMADAENFINKYKEANDLSVLSSVINSITGDKVFEFVTSTNKKLDTSKNNPWYGTGPMISVSGNTCYLDLTEYKDEYEITKYIYPIKNWDFKEISTIVDVNSKKLKSKEFNNHYITSNPIYETQPVLNVRNASAQYFKSKYDAISEQPYGKDVETRFKQLGNVDFKSDFKIYDKHFVIGNPNGPTFFDANQKRKSLLDSVNYDDNGKASIMNDCVLDIKNLFIKEDFYRKNNQDQAISFIMSVFENCHPRRATYESVINNPKFSVLYGGAFLLTQPNLPYDCNPAIKEFLTDYFKNWVEDDNGFKKIKNYFSLQLKPGKTSSAFTEELSKKNTKEEQASVISNYIENANRFASIYFIMDDSSDIPSKDRIGKAYLIPVRDNTLNEIMEDLMSVITICYETSFNIFNLQHGGTLPTPVAKNEIGAYLDGVVEKLKEKLGNSNNKEQNENVEVQANTDPDDIKVGVYNYIKLLYDKWLATNNQKDFYTMEKLFGNNGNNSTFHFIDSFYSKVGQTMYLNLDSIVNLLMSCQQNAGYTLLSLLSKLYSDNKFLFICVQNFADFSNPNTLDDMFKPIPYIELGGFPENTPNFIVLYPHAPSSKLDIEGADYPDDGFYLNDENESNWPLSIRNKSGNPIPSFGVCYGQQYQNYFKNIQVDMNSPMATEQSIRAKFLIAGADPDTGNQGTQIKTTGQDLYTIYANNSYTCTVTMMGCAWIQPMMYFVLQNIPMFRGSYMIVKVNHQIRPGFMTTTFKGVRMSACGTRAVQSPVFGGTLDNSGSYNGGSGFQSDAERKNKEYELAEIKNDCEYQYNDPIEREVKLPTNEDKQAYCYATFLLLKQFTKGKEVELNDVQAKGICANCLVECGFNPYMVTIDGNKSRNEHGVGGGLASFYYKGEAVGLFKFIYGEEEGRKKLDELNASVEYVWKENPVICSRTNQDKLANDGITYPIPFEEQVRYLAHRAQSFPGITSCTTESEAAIFWCKKYERPLNAKDRWNAKRGSSTCGEWVESAIAAGRKIEQEEEAPSGTTIEDIAEGLRKSVELSIRKTNSHNECNVILRKVSSSTDNNDYYEYRTEKHEENKLLFDCLLKSYGNWFDRISWDVGDQSIDSDANSVTVNIVNKKPETQTIYITYSSANGKKNAQITKKEEINESLRLSLIKYFKSHSISTGPSAKSIFRSMVADDSDVEEWFELSGNKSIKDCSTLLGGAVNGNATPYDGPIPNNWSEAVQTVGGWYEKNVTTYQNYSCKPYGSDRKRRAYAFQDGWNVMDDCSSFVGACLQAIGVFEKDYNPPRSKQYVTENSDCANKLKSGGFVLQWCNMNGESVGNLYNSGILRPYDIIAYDGHVEIFYGKKENGSLASYGWGSVHNPSVVCDNKNRPKMPAGINKSTKYTHIWRKTT